MSADPLQDALRTAAAKADAVLAAVGKEIESGRCQTRLQQLWAATCDDPVHVAASTVAGTATYAIGLLGAQVLVLKPLGIGTQRPRLASLCGAAVVGAAGLAACEVTTQILCRPSLTRQLQRLWSSDVTNNTGSTGNNKKDNSTTTTTTTTTTGSGKPMTLTPFGDASVARPLGYALGIVLSCALFRLQGGRFRAIAPSSLYNPGAFGQVSGSIPASGREYATTSERAQLLALGKKHGCHTCGRRWFTGFVGDHMPPNYLVKPGQKQRFYPQCTTCSNLQGATIRAGKVKLMSHWSSPRYYHLWLPFGFVFLFAFGLV